MKFNKENKKNFFIIGCNRSGTSLLRTMLNHHPEVAIPLEAVFLVDYLKASGKVDITTQKKFLKGEPRMHDWGVRIDNNQLKRIKNTADIIKIIHEQYSNNNDKKIWGDKTPRLTRYTHLIKKHLPDAKFIHVIRDPRAVAISLTRSNIQKSNIYFGALRWLKYVKAALDMEKKHKDDFLRVHYEDMVSNPKKELRRVCKFLNINYTNEMMNYQKTGNNEYRQYHRTALSTLNKKPQISRIDAWKKELSPGEIKTIEHLCGDLMQDLGYKRMNKDTSISKEALYYYKAERVYGFIWQFTRYALLWPADLIHSIRRKLAFGTFRDEMGDVNY